MNNKNDQIPHASPETTVATNYFMRLHMVTPISRYLALTLFVILPFLGGWIGYHYAPEKIVEVERLVIKEADAPVKLGESQSAMMVASSTSDVWIDQYECENINLLPCFRVTSKDGIHHISNLNEPFALAAEEIVSNKNIRLFELLYFSSTTRNAYFQAGIPRSDGCCNLVVYNVTTAKFTKDIRYTNPALSKFSKDGRILVAVDSVGKTLRVYDLEFDKEIYSHTATAETLFECSHQQCGFFGEHASVNIDPNNYRVTFSEYTEVEPPLENVVVETITIDVKELIE